MTFLAFILGLLLGGTIILVSVVVAATIEDGAHKRYLERSRDAREAEEAALRLKIFGEEK